MQAATVIHCQTNINPQTPTSTTTASNAATTHPANDLTVPVPVPVAGQAAVAHSRAVLPLQASASNTSFENLPIAVVLDILWPYLSDLPTMRAIEQAFRFGGSLNQWLAPIEARVTQDIAAFKNSLGDRMSQEAWAVSFAADGNRRDYLHAGLSAYPGNRFWATHFRLPGIEGDNIDLRTVFAHRIDGLRIAMEHVVRALFEAAPLADHRYLLASVEELYVGNKGFANVQLVQEKARDVGLGSVVNFTRPSYSHATLNKIRMLILQSAVEVIQAQALQRAQAANTTA